MLHSTLDKEFRTDTVRIQQDEHFETEANIAIEFATKWGMVAAIPDGEDSAGRSRMRLLTPDEIVNRAFEVAALVMSKARASGLVHKCQLLPPEKRGK